MVEKLSYELKQERKDRLLALIKVQDQTAGVLYEALRHHYPDLSRRALTEYLSQLQAEGKIINLGTNKRNARYRFIPEPIDPVDALVIHSALRMFYHHTPGHNGRYFHMLHKLAEPLPKHVREIAEASTKSLSLRKASKTKEQDQGQIIACLAEGWFKQRLVEFEYRKQGGSGAWRKNVLEVYFMEVNRTNLGLYVIGYERGFHNHLRTFKISRIRNVKVTEVPYVQDPSFNPEDFLFNAWGVMGQKSSGGLTEVHLRFAPEVVGWVEEINYPGVKSRRSNDDKSLEVWLEVGSDNDKFPREVFSWIQGWGPRVEVLGPKGLRERWLEEARQVAKYGKTI